MTLKRVPNTPGTRHLRTVVPTGMFRTKPEKSLLCGCNKTGGRNNYGRRTMRYIGGGHKRLLRDIDFKFRKQNVEGIVKSIDYDPFRTGFIALVHYKDGQKSYILASEGLKVGDTVVAGPEVVPNISCVLPLSKIPNGTFIYNIELNPGAGAKLVRSAGCYAQLLSKDDSFATVKLPSGEKRLIRSSCNASVGIVSNSAHANEKKGKAGINRHLGWRPRTRGVAMNPVDHPMGGGEGKNAGQHPRSRKGLSAKGLKTRRRKFSDRYILKN